MTLAEQVQLQRSRAQADSARTRLEVRLPVVRLREGTLVVRRTVKVRSVFVCIGCGRERSRKPYGYGPVCKRRMTLGYETLDVDDVPTKSECRRVIAGE